MMKLKHQRCIGQKRRPLARIIAFASTLLVAGAMGCTSVNRPPPENMRTRCWSFGVPPHEHMEENLEPMERYEMQRPGPMGAYIRCISIEDPSMGGETKAE